jgi:hypothetical protein
MISYHYPYAIGMCSQAGAVCPQAMRMIVKIYDRGVIFCRYNIIPEQKSPVAKNGRAFLCPQIKCAMKFIVAVFMVRFVIELTGKAIKKE